MRGLNTDKRKPLLILMDNPDKVSDSIGRPFSEEHGAMLRWLLDCMSVKLDDVAVDYVLRCYGKTPKSKSERTTVIQECGSYRYKAIKRIKPKVIVTLGELALFALTGKHQIGKAEGDRFRAWEGVVNQYAPHVWATYSLAYALTSPSGTPKVFRTMFSAAEEAGLNPQLNPRIKPFQWRNIL